MWFIIPWLKPKGLLFCSYKPVTSIKTNLLQVLTLNLLRVYNRITVNLLQVKAMDKPKGGRGKKAPYETTIKRIPIELESQIESMIETYRLKVIDGIESQDTGIMPIEKTKELSRKLLRAKTSKINTVIKLVTSIYGVEIDKDELL